MKAGNFREISQWLKILTKPFFEKIDLDFTRVPARPQEFPVFHAVRLDESFHSRYSDRVAAQNSNEIFDYRFGQKIAT